MPSRSILVIGKNSRLFREVAPSLGAHTAISHDEIAGTDLSRFDDIFVFSWDFHALQPNLDLLAGLPGDRTVLISTTAVHALQLRPQWNVYPNAKAAAESQVLARGGKVVRVGITSEELLDQLHGTVPVTRPEALAKLMSAWDGTQARVIDLVSLERGRLSGMALRLALLVSALSLALPASRLLQMPLQAIAKALRIKHCGYTADMLRFFADELLVGYGALGSTYDRARPSATRAVLVSGRPNLTLDGDGFVHTVIGLDRIGLAALWHGVETTPCPDDPGKARKKVPLFIPRRRPPRSRTCVAHVERVAFERDSQRWRVDAAAPNGRAVQFLATRLVLAAGAIENARLLMGPGAPRARFSDHEIAMVGACPTASALAVGGVSKLGPLIRRSFSRLQDADGVPFVIEFRPFVASKHGTGKKDATFYLTSTGGVVKKLIGDLSLSRLNEAIYNKLGVAVNPGTCSVFVQAVSRNAIQVELSAGSRVSLSRSRLTSAVWATILSRASHLIPGFEAAATITSVDAQHIMGGAELFAAPGTQELVKAGHLVVLGSPTDQELSAVHNTPAMQREAVQRARAS